MKALFIPVALIVVLLTASDATAQQPDQPPIVESQANLTPEMWLYQQQLEQYNDPKTIVRRNAEFQHQQRLARLETLKWYGFSNARPMASPTPFSSMYSPAWQANWHRPYAWYTAGRPTVIATGRGWGE